MRYTIHHGGLDEHGLLIVWDNFGKRIIARGFEPERDGLEQLIRLANEADETILE